MVWIIGIIAFLAGVVATGLIYRRNRKKMDKLVDAGKKTVKDKFKKK